MSGVFKAIGKIAGVVATVASIIPGGQVIAAIAAGVAVVSSTVGELTATKPPAYTGSVTDITIGADQPTPYMIGDTYYGGNLVHQVGYGNPINTVPNPYLAMAVIYSAGGPIAGIDSYYADFNALAFKAGSAIGEADGYFSEILFKQAQLGATPEPGALAGPFGAIPDWGASYKLSGKAAVLWSLKFDSKNGKYASGAPQLGIRGRGVKTWDPRLDETWPGGSGTHRWADPRSERAGFDGARLTWTYSDRPGLHALRYALGTWERDPAVAESDYILTYGIGFPIGSVVVEDFVELEGICEANDWRVAGVLFEPGDKWANLKKILVAGGAEPCFKGGRLGLKITAPRVALDTIRREDIADGDITAAGGQPWRDRINTAIPTYTSPDHKWTKQQSPAIGVAEFVAADGEEKRREVVLEMVTDVDQAASLTLYELYNSREQGPIQLPCGPRLRRYVGGDKLVLADDLAADLGLAEKNVVILTKQFDPAAMVSTLTVVTETAAKHAAALGATGVAPEAITVPTTADLDGTAFSPLADVATTTDFADAQATISAQAALIAAQADTLTSLDQRLRSLEEPTS